MSRVLSTKKLKPNQRQYLLNAGLSVVEADFIETKPLPFSLDNIQEHLIFTSAQAVAAVAGHPDVQSIRRKPCFCVGQKTADALDEAGFTVMEIVDNAAELSRVIVENYAAGNFTFFCGNLRLDTLPNALAQANVGCNEVEVYHTALTPKILNMAVDGILFFSPSAVDSFLAANELAGQTCFCIGETTASALATKTQNIVLAHKPSIENVIIQTIQFFK